MCNKRCTIILSRKSYVKGPNNYMNTDFIEWIIGQETAQLAKLDINFAFSIYQ